MVEIPEHLLKRSQAARQAAQSTSGGEETAAEETAGAPEPSASSDAAQPSEPPTAGAALPAEQPSSIEPVVEAHVPAAPSPPKVYAPASRLSGTYKASYGAKVPSWMQAVYLAVPVLAIGFVVAFTQLGIEESSGPDPLAEGKKIFASSCASCHGKQGEGSATAPSLKNVLSVFPDTQDHIDWVADGSLSFAGKRYGADKLGNNEGVATGGMAGFSTSLTAEEIQAVVQYERVEFGGEELPSEGEEPTEGEEPGLESSAAE